jgi:nucleotide-binding universal stress UspA family protein
MYPPDGSGAKAEDMIMDLWLAQADAAQTQAVANLKESTELPKILTSEVASGRSWASALGSLEWRDDEVLVIGSSSAGALSRIFLGSAAAKIIRHSPVPIIVVP